MCFSASASFGAGAILSVIGIVSLKKVQQPSQIPFATIPLIFAAQQITEGVLWLALSNPVYSSAEIFCTNVFIFFAQVVWPVWVPFAIIKLHKKENRKWAEKVLVGVGTTVSFYLAYCLMNYEIKASILGMHISYEQVYPKVLSKYSGVLYIIATIVPPFFSKIKYMWTLGLSIFISYIVTTIFYEDYIVSVWCFFASIISITVAVVMNQMRSSDNTSKTIAAAVVN